MLKAVTRQKKRERAKEKRREEANRRGCFEHWYAPSVKDVYAQLMIAKTMLDRIPDQELAIVKREMGLLEDMVWQFCH